MTIANDGEQYLYLTPDGCPVTFTVAIVGQIACYSCGSAWQAAEMHDLTDLEYARGCIQAAATWRALYHAKTCKGAQ